MSKDYKYEKFEAVGANKHSYGVVQLEKKLGGGGEGDVYSIVDMPNLIHGGEVWNKDNTVAKIYFEPASREEKVTAMLKTYPHNITWAFATLYQNGKFMGFLMPKLDFRVFDTWGNYSNKKQRDKIAPDFTYGHAFVAIINFANVLKGVHELGHVIGDLNESNQLIGKDVSVFIVDADSAQIRDGGKIYPSIVGKPEYTAPELIGKSFKTVKRTKATDIFAFSVLVWQLLTGGVHPVQGIPPKNQPNQVPPNLSIAQKIKAGFYPALGALPYGYKPPIASPTTAIPKRIRDIIGRGLSTDPAKRPSIEEFIKVFTDVAGSMTQCVDDDEHYWDKNDSALCPWCARDAKKLPNPWGGGNPVNLATRMGKLKAHNQIVLPVKSVTTKPQPAPTPQKQKSSSKATIVAPPVSTSKPVITPSKQLKTSVSKTVAPVAPFNSTTVAQNTPTTVPSSNLVFQPPTPQSNKIVPSAPAHPNPPVRPIRPPRRRRNAPSNPETPSSLQIMTSTGLENYEPNKVGVESLKLFFFGWLKKQQGMSVSWSNKYKPSPLGLTAALIYAAIVPIIYFLVFQSFESSNIVLQTLFGLLLLLTVYSTIFFVVSGFIMGRVSEFSDRESATYSIFKTLVATVIGPLQWLVFYGRFTYVVFLRLVKAFSFKRLLAMFAVLLGWAGLLGAAWFIGVFL